MLTCSWSILDTQVSLRFWYCGLTHTNKQKMTGVGGADVLDTHAQKWFSMLRTHTHSQSFFQCYGPPSPTPHTCFLMLRTTIHTHTYPHQKANFFRPTPTLPPQITDSTSYNATPHHDNMLMYLARGFIQFSLATFLLLSKLLFL